MLIEYFYDRIVGSVCKRDDEPEGHDRRGASAAGQIRSADGNQSAGLGGPPADSQDPFRQTVNKREALERREASRTRIAHKELLGRRNRGTRSRVDHPRHEPTHQGLLGFIPMNLPDFFDLI